MVALPLALCAAQLAHADDEAATCRTAAGFDERGYWGAGPEVGERAIAICRAALALAPDDAALQAYLARALYLHNQPDEARRLIETSAAHSVIGKTLMGVSYEYGYGAAADLSQAADWYQRAAQSGFAMAQLNLARLYFTGRGVAKDLTKALALLHEAAMQGNVTAQATLGSVYERGQGVPQNDSEALRWYRLAADARYGAATLRLAEMMAEGRGTTADPVEAARRLRAAISQGISPWP